MSDQAHKERVFRNGQKVKYALLLAGKRLDQKRLVESSLENTKIKKSRKNVVIQQCPKMSVIEELREPLQRDNYGSIGYKNDFCHVEVCAARAQNSARSNSNKKNLFRNSSSRSADQLNDDEFLNQKSRIKFGKKWMNLTKIGYGTILTEEQKALLADKEIKNQGALNLNDDNQDAEAEDDENAQIIIDKARGDGGDDDIEIADLEENAEDDGSSSAAGEGQDGDEIEANGDVNKQDGGSGEDDGEGKDSKSEEDELQKICEQIETGIFLDSDGGEQGVDHKDEIEHITPMEEAEEVAAEAAEMDNIEMEAIEHDIEAEIEASLGDENLNGLIDLLDDLETGEANNNDQNNLNDFDNFAFNNLGDDDMELDGLDRSGIDPDECGDDDDEDEEEMDEDYDDHEGDEDDGDVALEYGGNEPIDGDNGQNDLNNDDIEDLDATIPGNEDNDLNGEEEDEDDEGGSSNNEDGNQDNIECDALLDNYEVSAEESSDGGDDDGSDIEVEITYFKETEMAYNMAMEVQYNQEGNDDVNDQDTSTGRGNESHMHVRLVSTSKRSDSRFLNINPGQGRDYCEPTTCFSPKPTAFNLTGIEDSNTPNRNLTELDKQVIECYNDKNLTSDSDNQTSHKCFLDKLPILKAIQAFQSSDFKNLKEEAGVVSNFALRKLSTSKQLHRMKTVSNLVRAGADNDNSDQDQENINEGDDEEGEGDEDNDEEPEEEPEGDISVDQLEPEHKEESKEENIHVPAPFENPSPDCSCSFPDESPYEEEEIYESCHSNLDFYNDSDHPDTEVGDSFSSRTFHDYEQESMNSEVTLSSEILERMEHCSLTDCDQEDRVDYSACDEE